MPNIRKVYLIPILLLVAALAGWYILSRFAGEGLTASGTIETTEVFARAEISEKVSQVLVEEGQTVYEGQTIARLDTADLDPLVWQADAAVRGAQARQNEAWAAQRSAAAKLAGARATCERPSPRQIEQITTALVEARLRSEQAQAGLLDAEATLTAAGESLPPTQFEMLTTDVEQATNVLNTAVDGLKQAQDQIDVARTACDRPSSSERLDQLRSALDQARSVFGPALDGLQSAERQLVEGQAGHTNPGQIAQLRGAIAQVRQANSDAQGRFDTAEARLADVTSGSSSPAQQQEFATAVEQARSNLAGAQASLHAAAAALADAQAVPENVSPGQLQQLQEAVDLATRSVDEDLASVRDAEVRLAIAEGQRPTPEQMAQLQATVDQAWAAVDEASANVDQANAAANLARARLNKATVRAPIAGVVLSRIQEPGAVVAPGAAIAQLANLNDLFINVFIPVTDVGRLTLGMPVHVYVDAFPNRPFAGEVVHISDQVEFTPRNVVTKEKRVTQVVAVKVQIRDGLNGELKPGMPADVVFPTEAE